MKRGEAMKKTGKNKQDKRDKKIICLYVGKAANIKIKFVPYIT